MSKWANTRKTQLTYYESKIEEMKNRLSNPLVRRETGQVDRKWLKKYQERLEEVKNDPDEAFSETDKPPFRSELPSFMEMKNAQ